MRYSKFFGKTKKESAASSDIISHQLLLRGGFVAESVAGRYYLLPAGWRVHEKIRQIVKQKMDAAGAQELLAPTLHPLELWAETNRTSTAGFELMQVVDRRGAEFALGGTAEEMIVDLVRKFQISYKDLPFNLYQFSTKFRDETRARGGLLRVREFVMKDAYSFHASEKCFEKTYEKMAEVYADIFAEVGLETEKVLADGGYIGGQYCHEFVAPCEVGESRYFVETFDRSGRAEQNLRSDVPVQIAHEDVCEIVPECPNPDEKVLDFETVELPEEVKNMDDLEKFYQMPKWRFLKNVVFRNRTSGEKVIAVIRGDLEVNRTKLEKILDAVGQLEPAEDSDLRSLGTKAGFVHSWGHDAKYVGDTSLQTVRNFYGGFKTETTDPQNVNYGRDFECEILADISTAFEGARSRNGGIWRQKIGVEVGNIFQLGTHYSSKMKGADFIDSDGKSRPFLMGCYGIGIGRTMATIVEKFHDDRGIIWPKNVAPFSVFLAPIGKDEEVFSVAEKIYAEFLAAGVDVLFDDRNDKKCGAGVKFADHELLGIPVRVVISEKSLAENKVEIAFRQNLDKSENVEIEKVLPRVQEFLAE